MTSPTADQRASAVLSGDYGGGGWADQAPYAEPGPRLSQAIASAIRQAENDAYEKAAALCDGITTETANRRRTSASPFFAGEIRSLKYPKET